MGNAAWNRLASLRAVALIALYRTFCLAFHVSAWTLGNTWKIEIDTDPVVPFTAAFLRQSRIRCTACPFGLQMQPACVPLRLGPLARRRGIVGTTLAPRNEMPVDLQLRFRQKNPPARLLDRLLAAGVDPARVGRALPPSSSSSTGGRN